MLLGTKIYIGLTRLTRLTNSVPTPLFTAADSPGLTCFARYKQQFLAD